MYQPGPSAPERAPWKDATVQSGLDAAMARVGDRWTLLVVDALFPGPLRFTDLQQAIPGVAPNILSARLRRLQADGLVVSVPYSERPQRLAYQVTDSGRELAGAVRLLTSWGSAHAEGDDAPRHGTCGTVLETRWYCPTCARVAEDGDDDLRWI
jgi:DNA-binding HxlR family transcriptional regulator